MRTRADNLEHRFSQIKTIGELAKLRLEQIKNASEINKLKNEKK